VAEAAEFADIHFICVGTPQLPGSLGADLGHIEAVVDALAASLTRDCLIVGKSTVPVGTAPRLAGPAGHAHRGRRHRPARLEPGVPAGGVRRAGHPAA